MASDNPLLLYSVMEKKNKFSNREKLKSKKAIALLFSEGKKINAFPIMAIYIQTSLPSQQVTKVGVAVSKKNIKLAVDRNLLKRRMREAYRLNNHALKNHLQQLPMGLNIMFVYTAKQILSYKEIEEKIKVILTRLIERSEVVDE